MGVHEVSTWAERKAARKAAYIAMHGVPQPRRVFRVYARSQFGYLPGRFADLPVGVFASRREAEDFIRDDGPGRQWGSHALRALQQMLTVAEFNSMPLGWAAYTAFVINPEQAGSPPSPKD